LFLEQDSPKREYVLTEEDQAEIRKMMEEKYANWEWNYGYSPKFNYEKTDRFDGGTLQVRLNVVKGIIEECKIYGDFFGVEDVQDVENRLKGVRYDRAAIQEALQGVDLDPYFGGITRDELLSCFF